MSCSALNVDLRHKDPPFFLKLLSLRDGGFLSACVRNGTWELEVGGAGGAGARFNFAAVGLQGSRAGYKYGNAPRWSPPGRCGRTSKTQCFQCFQVSILRKSLQLKKALRLFKYSGSHLHFSVYYYFL